MTLDRTSAVGGGCHAWVAASLTSSSSFGAGGSPQIDPAFTQRALGALEVYAGARGLAHAEGGLAGQAAQGARPAMKRQVKLVLLDVAKVGAGEASAEDCIYDVAGF